MYNLYPHQKQLKHLAAKGIAEGHINQVVVSPTASGKTLVMADIARGANEKGNRVLTLTHKHEIHEQTLKKYYMFGVQAGQIVSGKPMTKELSQVAMVQTLVNRLHLIKKPDLIIIDEGHHGLANTWKKILKPYDDIPKLYFTATPEAAGGVGMGSICTNMIQGLQPRELVEQGYLAYCLTLRPPEKEKMNFHKTAGDFDLNEQEEFYRKKSVYGNVIEHYKQYLDGMPTIVSCTNLRHCHAMVEHYIDYAKQTGKEWKAVMVQGGQKHRKQREDAFNGLKNGSVQQVMFCNLLDEGVDIPDVMGCQMFRKTTSLRLYMQICGRILRPAYKPNHDLSTVENRLKAQREWIKPYAILLDHAGNSLPENHGHILCDRQWSLDSIEKTKRKNDKVPTTTSCPKCYGVWPGEPKTCPSCGFIFAEKKDIAMQQRKMPKQIEGELIAAFPDIEADSIRDITKQAMRLQNLSPATRQKAMLAMAYKSVNKREIEALAKAVGYKENWTDYTWKKILKKA